MRRHREHENENKSKAPQRQTACMIISSIHFGASHNSAFAHQFEKESIKRSDGHIQNNRRWLASWGSCTHLNDINIQAIVK